MTTRLESLKVTAELDAAPYVQAAQQKAAADKAMVDSGAQVDAAVSSTQQKLGLSQSAIDKLTRTLDPAAAGQQRFESAQRRINAAVDAGSISVSRGNDLLEKARARYLDFGAGADTAGTKVEGLRDIFGLASAAMTGNTFAMSRASAGLANSFGILRLAMNPLTAGAALVGAAFVAAAGHADALNTQARQLDVTLTAAGKSAVISASQLGQVVAQLRAAGIASSDANASVRAAAAVPGASLSTIQRAGSYAPDFAAAFGTGIADATVKLTEMGTAGYASIKKLDDAYNFLSPDQLRHIRQLSEAGDRVGALDAAYAALGERIKDAAGKSQTEWGKAVADLKTAIQGLWDKIAEGAVGQVTLKVGVSFIEGLAHPGAAAGQAAYGGLASLLGALFPGLGAAAMSYNLGTNVAEPALGNTLSGGVNAPPSATAALYPTVRPVPKPPAPQAVPFTAGEKEIEAEADAYRKLAAAQQTDLANRTVAVAAAQAEISVEDKQISDKAKHETVILAVAKARDKLALAADDNLKALAAETAAQEKVAAAYAVSDAAGAAAEAQAKAESDARTNSAVNVAAAAAAYRDLAAAQAVVSGQKIVNEAAAELDAERNLSAATLQSARAAEEANRQNDVAAKFRDAIAKATDGTRASIYAERDAYDAETRSILANKDATADALAIRQASRAAGLAALKAQAAQITDPDVAAAAQIQIARQQEINQLVDEYGTIAEGTGKKLLAMWDQQAASEDQARYWNEVKSQAKTVADDVKGWFVDAFVNVNNGGKSTFENLWDAVKAGAKRLAVNIAATFAEQQIILPITMAIVGGSSGLFGIASPVSAAEISGASAASGGGFSLSNLSSLSNIFTGLQSKFLGNAFASAAGFLGFSPETAAFFGNAGLNSPYALIGGLAANLLGLSNGATSTIGSTLGGLAGGAFLGPLGAIGGSFLGSVLGGLFGPGKSVGPNATAQLAYRNGQFTVGNRGADNGGDLAGTVGLVQQVADALNALAAQYGIVPVKAGNDPWGTVVNASGRLFAAGYGAGFAGPSTAAGLFTNLITGHALTSSDPVIAAVLANTKATDQAGITADLQFAAQYKALTDSADTAAAAVAAVTGQFDQMKSKAQELGLSIGAVTAAETSALEDLKAQTISNVVSLRAQIEGELGVTGLSQASAALAVSNLSPLSQQQRLTAAQGSYASTLAAAQGGDLAAIASFPGALQTYLGAAQSYYGGASQQYAAIFAAGNKDLNDLLAKQHDQEMSLLGDVSVTIQQAAQAQIDANVKQFTTQNQILQKIYTALQQLNAA